MVIMMIVGDSVVHGILTKVMGLLHLDDVTVSNTRFQVLNDEIE